MDERLEIASRILAKSSFFIKNLEGKKQRVRFSLDMADMLLEQHNDDIQEGRITDDGMKVDD